MRLILFLMITFVLSACIKERHLESPEFQKLPPYKKHKVEQYIHALQAITFSELGFTERWRPQFHLTPAFGEMRAPVSLVRNHDVWHFFYQTSDTSITLNKAWGHAISKDLAHWKLLPVAIIPDSSEHIGSGEVVYDQANTTGLFDDKGGFVAIFTNETKSVCELAYSEKGIYWHDDTKKLQLPDSTNVLKVFWHEESLQWVLLGALNKDVFVFQSKDLLNWKKKGMLVQNIDDHFFFLLKVPLEHKQQQKWILSSNRERYMVGEFDGERFYPDGELSNPFPIPQHTSSQFDDKGNLIAMSTLDISTNPQYQTSPWKGSADIPKVLSLRKASGQFYQLIQTTIASIDELHRENVELKNIVIGSEWKDLKDDLILGNLIELNLEIKPGNKSHFMLEVLKGQREACLVEYDAEAEVLSIQQEKMVAGESQLTPIASSLLKPKDGIIRLKVFVDVSIVEVIGNDGDVFLSSCIYPSPLSQSIRIRSDVSNTTLALLTSYQMYSFWKEEFYKIQRTIAEKPFLSLGINQKHAFEAGVFPYYLQVDSVKWSVLHPELIDIIPSGSQNQVILKAKKSGNTKLIVDSYKGIPDTVEILVEP